MLISQTPLRISFAGGGTDFDAYSREFGGEVIGSAIDKYVFVFMKERFDRKIIVSWRQFESVEHVDQIQHELVREAMKLTKIDRGVEVITTADIPSEGSGLGSSSALCVGLLNAFFTFQNRQCGIDQLAGQASTIEIDQLKHPIGRQDHFLAAFGGIQHLKFNGKEKVIVEKVEVSRDTWLQLNRETMLFYTGITRRASEILVKQTAAIQNHLPSYHALKALVPRMREALEEGNLANFGPLLHEGWQIKQSLADSISNPEVEKMYETARAAGATGGKLCGAGGGGFLFLSCPVERQRQVREALWGYSEAPFQFEEDGAKILLNVRRPMWKSFSK